VDVYLEKNNNETKEEILKNIDQWYNGYSVIKTEKKIFSSFSILNYLRSLQLRSYWKDKIGSSRLESRLSGCRDLISSKGSPSIKSYWRNDVNQYC
jgi:hypothetical protein